MWFSANLLFKSHHPASPEREALWESSVILIDAHSEADASSIAEKLGLGKEEEYVSSSGDLVRWRFEKIERVFAIDEPLQHGAELFSMFLLESEVKSILTPIGNE